jgi:class 3 adenylate cyclase
MDGIIDGVIRMDDFIRASIAPVFLQNMHMQIHDHAVAEQNVLFDSMKGRNPDSLARRFHSEKVVQYYGQKWIISLEGQPAANFLPLFFGPKSKNLNLVILVTGCLLSGLGFYVTRGFQTTARLRKEKLADALSLKADKDIIRRQEASLLQFTERSEYLIVCIIDVVDSTGITRHLADRQSAEFYGAFHNIMGRVVLAHHGTIVKTMGDAILFSFQATDPPTSEQCQRAIHCCLDMIEANRELNELLNSKHLPEVNYRISVVPGSVMAASKDGVADIFGSTVNQCSKINRFAAPNGLVVSEDLQTSLGNDNGYEVKKIEQTIAAQSAEGVYRVSRSL